MSQRSIKTSGLYVRDALRYSESTPYISFAQRYSFN